MEARLAIRPSVNARLACARLTPEHLAELATAVEDLKKAPRGPSFADYRDYLEADERFHRLIAERTDNQFMVAAYATLGGQVQRFRLFGGVGITDAEQAIAEHQAVLDALSLRRDGEGRSRHGRARAERCAAAPSPDAPRRIRPPSPRGFFTASRSGDPPPTQQLS